MPNPARCRWSRRDDPSTLRPFARFLHLLFETTPVGSYPDGVSPIGCWGVLANVWEWASTDFHGYPGYQTIRNTFRNWDYPTRRQIFSGVRCVRDG